MTESKTVAILDNIDPIPSKRFEYKTERHAITQKFLTPQSHDKHVISILNKFGAAGWRLHNITAGPTASGLELVFLLEREVLQ